MILCNRHTSLKSWCHSSLVVLMVVTSTPTAKLFSGPRWLSDRLTSCNCFSHILHYTLYSSETGDLTDQSICRNSSYSRIFSIILALLGIVVHWNEDQLQFCISNIGLKADNARCISAPYTNRNATFKDMEGLWVVGTSCLPKHSY